MTTVKLCCNCLQTTSDYDTIRPADSERVWHYCRKPECHEAYVDDCVAIAAQVSS